MTEVAEKLL